MWTSLSASRWICLLTLAVVMLVSASQVDSFSFVGHDCCHGGQIRKVRKIMTCNKQESRRGCPYDAYMLESPYRTQPICVQSTAQWLKELLDTDKLTCPPLFSNGRFEVLDDEDDVEW